MHAVKLQREVSTTGLTHTCRDAKTQTFLTSFKENLSNCNAFTSLGKDHLIAAQAGKSQAMHVWSWHKVGLSSPRKYTCISRSKQTHLSL